MTTTLPFDAAEHLETKEDVAFFLADALETGDERYIYHALGIAARARGMSEIARQSGMKREALYRALSETGNPQFSTILAVLKALDLRLTIAPAEAPRERAA